MGFGWDSPGGGEAGRLALKVPDMTGKGRQVSTVAGPLERVYLFSVLQSKMWRHRWEARAKQVAVVVRHIRRHDRRGVMKAETSNSSAAIGTQTTQ